MVATIRASGIAKYAFQGIRRWPHIEVASHEASSILVVIFKRMACNMLTPQDTLAIIPIASEGQAGNTVTLSQDWLIHLIEAKDNVMKPLVIDHIYDRPTAAYYHQGIVLCQFCLCTV